MLLVVGYQLLVGASAQTPITQIIITWRANNFYPADYKGKALAAPNTPITVGAEIIQNNKFADSSKASFIWYVDEKLISRGDGLKEAMFTANKPVGDSHFVMVSVKLDGKTIENSVRIPVERPIVVVDLPLPGSITRAGSEILIRAVPFFFNVPSLDDLKFSWQVNDQKTEGKDSLLLKIGAPQTQSQKIIRIDSFVQNLRDLLEFGRVKSQLFVE